MRRHTVDRQGLPGELDDRMSVVGERDQVAYTPGRSTATPPSTSRATAASRARRSGASSNPRASRRLVGKTSAALDLRDREAVF